MECVYCKKTLSSKSALRVHQEKTLYCLKIQGKKDIGGGFECHFCEKRFTTKSKRDNHHNICGVNSLKIAEMKKDFDKKKLAYEKKIKNINESHTKKFLAYEKKFLVYEKEVQIINKLYTDLVNTVAKKPTYSTKNYSKNITINNLSAFDKSNDEIEKSVLDNYTEYHLRNGQKGVAWFTHDHITSHLPEEKPKYLISDKSRGHGVYKENDDGLIQDTYMENLTQKIYPSIKRKAAIIARNSDGEILSDKELMDGWCDTQKLFNDNTSFCKEYIKKNSLI